ncbi:MAG: DEAD/DEAH box helicase, partial [Proteocatella sp.]
MKNKFDLNMDKLRKDLLKNIYEGNHVTDAELNLTDLAIYSNNNSLFSKLSRALNLSELDENICLTNEQVECLSILEDNNLFLSAPTSFGKTYIALEYISRNTSRLNNIIFVVPTISLMNELRKKCYTFFNKEYILITSDAELEQYYYESKKIMIVVPERISTK